METLMENDTARIVVEYAIMAVELAKTWLLSPAAWSQFALLLIAFLAARWITKQLQPILTRLISHKSDADTLLNQMRDFVIRLLPLLMPLLAYGLTGIGESITRSIFDTGAVIALGKRVFLFVAMRIFVLQVLQDPMLKVLGRYVLIPAALLYVLGLIDPVFARLDGVIMPLGDLSFSVLDLLRFMIVSGLFFWLGRWSNDQTSRAISQQEEMRPATKELATKAAQIVIFGVAFLLVMNIMGIPLTALAVFGGAVGVGLGFGLQQIASNFISGVILLIEGQTTVGDYVELDNGEAGTIVKTTARSMILETFDGRWIVVPNEHFITTRVVNYSDQGSANRYEANFLVSYDTDINLVPDIVEKAVGKHPDVLSTPYPPDCELRGFGESGIEFAVEFWVNGIDDGRHKYTSDVLFIVWNALKGAQIEIPYPHRVIEFKGQPPMPQS